MRYDTFSCEQIICFFQFVSNERCGIPQIDNGIISNFIGYLYLVFGDLFIDDILSEYNQNFNSYKIIRYTDDIYISVNFNPQISQKEQDILIHEVASRLAEVLYTKLGLKLNWKTKLYKLSKTADKERLLKYIKKRPSPSEEYSGFQSDSDNDEENDNQGSDVTNETPQEKLDKIFKELRKIKKISIEKYFTQAIPAQEETLQQDLRKKHM
jgi:hypothetical protein